MEEIQRMFPQYGDITLHIHAHPSAPHTRIKEQLSDGTYKVDIAAPPEDGIANAELVRFFARMFKLPKTNIEVIAGKSNRRKIIRVHR